jgi:putative FmdB family regulatory protein
VPTYDYQCRKCGNTTEVIHSMLADGPTTCELCGGPLRRVLYPAGIIFKGSGFYKTDSRGSSSSSVAASSSHDGHKTSADGAGKADGSTSPANGSASAAASGGSEAKGGPSHSETSSSSADKK